MTRRDARYMRQVDEAGTAAVEFALLLPVMLLLYFGMVQLTALLSLTHKLSSASASVADIVSRYRTVTQMTDIYDAFQAGRLVMASSAATNVQTRIFVYRPRSNAAPRVISTMQDGAQPRCEAPKAADLQGLALTGSDIIVVVSCASFRFPMPTVLKFEVFPDSTIILRRQTIMRPRGNQRFTCKDCPTS